MPVLFEVDDSAAPVRQFQSNAGAFQWDNATNPHDGAHLSWAKGLNRSRHGRSRARDDRAKCFNNLPAIRWLKLPKRTANQRLFEGSKLVKANH
jgi:hypothetical protein